MVACDRRNVRRAFAFDFPKDSDLKHLATEMLHFVLRRRAQERIRVLCEKRIQGTLARSLQSLPVTRQGSRFPAGWELVQREPWVVVGGRLIRNRSLRQQQDCGCRCPRWE